MLYGEGLSFFIVHHSKQAAEIGLWKPVYGLPPHMFEVSLCGGQPGNEGLLHGGENLPSSSSPIICLSHFISPSSSACFSTITLLENVMLSCGGCCGAPFSCTPGGERSSVHAGPAGFDPGIFQACTSSKTSAQQQMLCLFSFSGRRWRSECRKPGFELTYHFGLHFALFFSSSQILGSLKLLFY